MTKKRAPRIRLDHVGIAVRNLPEAMERYSKLLGKPASPIEEVMSEKVRVSFLELEGCRIELLEGTSPESPVRKFLDGGRSGVHHLSICLESGDIDAFFQLLKESGTAVLGESARAGSEGSRIFFLHPRAADGVLIEFSQKKGEKPR